MCNTRERERDRSPRNECGKAAGSQNLHLSETYRVVTEEDYLPKEGRTYCLVGSVRKRIKVCLPEEKTGGHTGYLISFSILKQRLEASSQKDGVRAFLSPPLRAPLANSVRKEGPSATSDKPQAGP